MNDNEFTTNNTETVRTISASTNSNNSLCSANITDTDASIQVSETAQAVIDSLFALN